MSHRKLVVEYALLCLRELRHEKMLEETTATLYGWLPLVRAEVATSPVFCCSLQERRPLRSTVFSYGNKHLKRCQPRVTNAKRSYNGLIVGDDSTNFLRPIQQLVYRVLPSITTLKAAPFRQYLGNGRLMLARANGLLHCVQKTALAQPAAKSKYDRDC